MQFSFSPVTVPRLCPQAQNTSSVRKLHVCPDVSSQETHFAHPPTDLMAPLGVLFFIPDNDDCVAALPVQLKSDDGKAMRKSGSKASSYRGHNTHSVADHSPMKTVWRNNYSQVLDTKPSEEEKGNAIVRWSESEPEQRMDRGDIAAKNGGSRVRQCIKEPQGQRRSELRGDYASTRSNNLTK